MSFDSVCIVCWNVNGILSCMERWEVRLLDRFVSQLETEINKELAGRRNCKLWICSFQEVKMRHHELDREMSVLNDWDVFYKLPESSFSNAIPFNRFSGIGTMHRRRLEPNVCLHPTINCCTGLSWALDLEDQNQYTKLFDQEGRCLTLILKDQNIALVNLYGVANRDESRIEIKDQSLEALRQLLEKLSATYSLVLTGDFNLTATPNDTCDPESWHARQHAARLSGKRSHAEWFNQICADFDLVDAFRYFHPDRKNAYTCWNQLSGARETNYGTRLDYILVHRPLIETYGLDAEIFPNIHGSDHCPVGLFLKSDCVLTVNALEPCRLAECAANQPQARIQQTLLNTKTLILTDQSVKAEDYSPRPRKKVHLDIQMRTQMSIHNFFTPKDKSPQLLPAGEAPRGVVRSPSDADLQVINLTEDTPPSAIANDNDTEQSLSSPSTLDKIMSSELIERMHDAVKYLSEKEQQLYFNQAQHAPKCPGHGLPSILRMTKKGPNMGRHFWTCCCASGDPTRLESRCNFFKWHKRRKTDR